MTTFWRTFHLLNIGDPYDRRETEAYFWSAEGECDEFNLYDDSDGEISE